MKILVTGSAGFIGFHLSKKLVSNKHQVIGLDNLNDYYEVALKKERLAELGISYKKDLAYNELISSSIFGDSFQFIRLDIQDKTRLPKLFEQERFDIVCNMAAQAGVRYSLENPGAYIDSNVVGFLNILECSKNYNIKHLIYASSSSVYGNKKKVPYATDDRTDQPISLYAATKKCNEILAYSYSHLFKIPTTGLRFFTVYGPWGRPDMAYYKFTESILHGKVIKVYNHGNQSRDFTYIDDIIEGLFLIIKKGVTKENIPVPHIIYNIGRGEPISLLEFIRVIEDKLGTIADKEMIPAQAGDVLQTWADTTDLKTDYDYQPKISLKEGLSNFINWYLDYKGLNKQ